MTNRLKKTVVLVGMMGAGKSAVGRALADRLHVPFMDSDEEIERAAAMSIPEIFERDGEAFFRARESEVIARLVQTDGAILSTGGGAFLQERNREVITASGVSLWLDAELQTLWNRVRHKTTRPLLRTKNPRKTLEEIYNARVPVYEKADLRVPSEPRQSIDRMVDKVIETLKQRPDVLETCDD